MIVFGPPSDVAMIEIAEAAKKQGISENSIYIEWVKNFLAEAMKRKIGDRSAIDHIFSEVLGFEVKVKKLFPTWFSLKGERYPAVSVEINDIEAANENLIDMGASVQKNIEQIGSAFGDVFRAAWVRASVEVYET